VKIGFIHVDLGGPEAELDYECASLMVRSARKQMPGIPIVQFTDLATKRVKHVYDVRRKPSEPMGLLRMRHCAGVEGHWLFVDTDVVFQQPVDQVFKRTFEIAVTSRNWSHMKDATGFSDRMPFNTGVVFSKCPRFWGEVYTRLRSLDPDLQHFMGEQQLINEVALEGRYHVKTFSGETYNFPPLMPDTLSPSKIQNRASILHYKGLERKQMMVGSVAQCA
jgi:hypothetical protein